MYNNGMDYIVKDQKLELIYTPGKGAWTYKINVPNTSEIKGSWGTIKVSGSINGYVIKSHNLMPNKGENMYMSINNDIRKHAKAVDGDLLDVTLYLDY